MSDSATASDSPFIKGRNARLYGKPRDTCPYSDGTDDRAAWLQAYDEAGDDGANPSSGPADPLKTP